jgi:pimeloyl-ACP methyl ester carboxylesterase
MGPRTGTVVLVHGAWHGAWCWDAVVAALDARGVEVDAVELPLAGYAADSETARARIEAAGDGAVVCGHSYGGLVISRAASGLGNVTRLVYLAAFQTEADEDPNAMLAADPSPLQTAFVFGDDGLTVDPERLHEVFYADSDRAVVAEIAPKLRPMPLTGEAWLAPEPAWKQVPSTFVVCANDAAIMPSLQRRMAVRATDVIELEADHSPFLTRPEELADLLASYLGGADGA